MAKYYNPLEHRHFGGSITLGTPALAWYCYSSEHRHLGSSIIPVKTSYYFPLDTDIGFVLLLSPILALCYYPRQKRHNWRSFDYPRQNRHYWQSFSIPENT